jgi:oleate hydratase
MAGHSSQRTHRDPKKIQAWLVGSGIASLAAAVHLIKDANVPASHIHILPAQSQAGGGIETVGNHEIGYTVHAGLQPYFSDPCVKELLSLVPHPVDQDKTLFDVIRDEKNGQENSPKAWTRILVHGQSGPERVDTRRLDLGLKDRLDLVRIMLEDETKLEEKSVREVFDTRFFQSNFWIFWSTTYVPFICDHCKLSSIKG